MPKKQKSIYIVLLFVRQQNVHLFGHLFHNQSNDIFFAIKLVSENSHNGHWKIRDAKCLNVCLVPVKVNVLPPVNNRKNI